MSKSVTIKGMLDFFASLITSSTGLLPLTNKIAAKSTMSAVLITWILINDVIKYNSSDKPVKQASFPQYKYPRAKIRYAKIADHLGLGGNSPDEKVDLLIDAINKLKAELDIPATIKEAGVTEEQFNSKVDKISELAFDDQCTAANPRYPLISEIKELYQKSFKGDL